MIIEGGRQAWKIRVSERSSCVRSVRAAVRIFANLSMRAVQCRDKLA